MSKNVDFFSVAPLYSTLCLDIRSMLLRTFHTTFITILAICPITRWSEKGKFILESTDLLNLVRKTRIYFKVHQFTKPWAKNVDSFSAEPLYGTLCLNFYCLPLIYSTIFPYHQNPPFMPPFIQPSLSTS